MEKNNLYYYGPKFWLIIHKYAYQNNKNKILKQFYVKMITDIFKLFPCKICQTHFSEVLKDFPIVNENDIFLWSFKIHNEVNIKQKKIKSPCIYKCEEYYSNISDQELLKSLFDVIFTFVSEYCSNIIKNFIENVAELNTHDIKKCLLHSLNVNYNCSVKTIDWCFNIYIDICNRFNINDRYIKNECIRFFEIKN